MFDINAVQQIPIDGFCGWTITNDFDGNDARQALEAVGLLVCEQSDGYILIANSLADEAFTACEIVGDDLEIHLICLAQSAEDNRCVFFCIDKAYDEPMICSLLSLEGVL